MTDFRTDSSVVRSDFGIVIAAAPPGNELMHLGVALHSVGKTSGFA